MNDLIDIIVFNTIHLDMQPFTPIDPDFYDIIPDQLAKGHVVVHFFKNIGEVDTAKGSGVSLQKTNQGDFLIFDDTQQVRIDRIISLNGRPGPAYDEYDNYALQCTTCMGGMD